MGQFRDRGFVGPDSLVWTPESGAIIIEGQIACLGNILISVLKMLEVLDGDGAEALVQTKYYAYNASLRGVGNLFRHDNADHHPNHRDRHHWHEYEWKTGTEREGSPFWCGADGWPSLGRFIEKAYAWYVEHRDELPDAEAFPELELGTRTVLSAD